VQFFQCSVEMTMDAEYFRRVLEPINHWYNLVTFSGLAAISSLILIHHNLDVAQDRMGTNFYQREEIFDFVIGEKTQNKLTLSTRFRLNSNNFQSNYLLNCTVGAGSAGAGR